MARIRSIKPEFPQSESMGRVSRDARLLFIQLWCICDDHGRTRASSRMLASLLFPYDDDAPAKMDGWLAELSREGCLVRYEHCGSQYLEICNWLKHQKIDRPSKPQFPSFDASQRTPSKPRESSCEDWIGLEGIGRDLHTGGDEDCSEPASVDGAEETQRVSQTEPSGLTKRYVKPTRARLTQITLDAIAAWNASPLVKPRGKLDPVDPEVGLPTWCAHVARCLPTAEDILRASDPDGQCEVTADFWEVYWSICNTDDVKSGRRPIANSKWVPCMEYLTRPEQMLAVYTRAEK